jgi:membrane protease YdiL (CAAX protease family)
MIKQRRAAQLCFFLAAFFAVWTVRATWFYAVDESISSPTLRAAYSDLLKLTLWVLPAAAFAYWLRRERPAKYLGLSAVPNWRNGSWCLVVTVAFLLATALFELAAGKKSFTPHRLASMLNVLGLLQLVVSPLLEELLFRGLVMTELMALLPSFQANALTSLLFVGAHLPFWLSHGGLTQAMMANAIGIYVFSLVAGWLFAKSSSIWPPTLAHIANNSLSFLLIASPG